MTNEQFWDSVARSWAASFARIPTEYPALHARILEGRRKKAEAEAAAKGDSNYIAAGNPTEVVKKKQPVSKLNKQEILTLAYALVALFASGFLN